MTTVEAVKAAKNPQGALLAIAQAIDDLRADIAKQRLEVDDGWGDWDSTTIEDDIDVPARVLEIEEDEGETTIHLKPVDEAKRERRRQFAINVLQLADNLPELGPGGPEVYAIGGPLWLYHGNRDLFMSYPDATRKMMCDDILEDDPTTADEVARDVLKDADPGNWAYAAEVFNGSVPG